jgi:hypothetical protein
MLSPVAGISCQAKLPDHPVAPAMCDCATGSTVTAEQYRDPAGLIIRPIIGWC